MLLLWSTQYYAAGMYFKDDGHGDYVKGKEHHIKIRLAGAVCMGICIHSFNQSIPLRIHGACSTVAEPVLPCFRLHCNAQTPVVIAWLTPPCTSTLGTFLLRSEPNELVFYCSQP